MRLSAFLAIFLLALPLHAQLLIDSFTLNAGPFTDTLGTGAGTETAFSINGSSATRLLNTSVDQPIPGVSTTTFIQNGTGWFSSGHVDEDNGYSSLLAYYDFPALDLTSIPYAEFQVGTITGTPILRFAVTDSLDNDALGVFDLTPDDSNTVISFDIRDMKLSDTVSINDIVSFQVSINGADSDSSAVITRFQFDAQEPLGHSATVPEPSSWLLAAVAVFSLAILGRLRTQKFSEADIATKV